jgi:hypothetical protein
MCHGPDVAPIDVHCPRGPGGIGITPTFLPRPALMIVESQSPPIQNTPFPFANRPADTSYFTAL